MQPLTISNVVATGKLSHKLDLELLHQNLPGSEQSASHWLKYRMQPGNRYVAFYKLGKFLLTGKDVLDKQDELVSQILQILADAGFPYSIEKFSINNIVAKTKIELNQSLDDIYVNLKSDRTEFEPEQFPAIIFKDFGATFLLFSTGSLIIAGTNNIEDTQKAYVKFVDLIS